MIEQICVVKGINVYFDEYHTDIDYISRVRCPKYPNEKYSGNGVLYINNETGITTDSNGNIPVIHKRSKLYVTKAYFVCIRDINRITLLIKKYEKYNYMRKRMQWKRLFKKSITQ